MRSGSRNSRPNRSVASTGSAAGASRIVRAARNPRASATATAAPPSECPTTAAAGPKCCTTANSVHANSGSVLRVPLLRPCAGWSKATTA